MTLRDATSPFDRETYQVRNDVMLDLKSLFDALMDNWLQKLNFTSRFEVSQTTLWPAILDYMYKPVNIEQ